MWTLPFKQVFGFRHPSEHLQDLVKEWFDVEVDKEYFIKELLVHKLDEDKNASLGYFPGTIKREGEMCLRKAGNIKKHEWFAFDALPENITDDLRKIMDAHARGMKYVQL